MLAQRHCCVHNMAYEIRNSNMYIKKNTLNVSEMASRDVRILNFVVVASTAKSGAFFTRLPEEVLCFCI